MWKNYITAKCKINEKMADQLQADNQGLLYVMNKSVSLKKRIIFNDGKLTKVHNEESLGWPLTKANIEEKMQDDASFTVKLIDCNHFYF